jgi:hypothetical protein
MPSDFIEVGGPVDDFVVSLIIYGEELDPDQITKRLGIEPSRARKRGWQSRHGVRPLPHGFWSLKREGKNPEDPGDTLSALLALLPDDDALWQDLSREFKIHVRFGIFLEDWNRGFGLPPAAVARVARLGAAMDFDIYGPGGPFDDPSPAPALAGPVATADAQRQVTVAILDTGIATHEWWDNSTWYEDCGTDVEDIVDADLDLELDSEAGHGTFVAGVVLQHAPTAHLCIDRVLSSDGVSDELTLVRALHRLHEQFDGRGQPLDVVNLSLGGYTYNNKPNHAADRAINRLDRRTAIVASAGNAASDRPFWPATIKRSIAVRALDRAHRRRAGFQLRLVGGCMRYR